MINKLKNREALDNKDLQLLQQSKVLVLQMLRDLKGKRAVKRFLQERFKVFERLYLHYLVYLGVEVTLSDHQHSKKIKLKKKQLLELKKVLIDSLADLESNKSELDAHFRENAEVYQYNNKLNYVTLELDIERAKFLVHNAKDIFIPNNYEEAIKSQHYLSLRKNLDKIILGVIYETVKKEPLNMDSLEENHFDSHWETKEIVLNRTAEALTHLYKLNRNLIIYLREQVISSIQPLLNRHQAGNQKDFLKGTIKQKIIKLIEEICIKHPNDHARLITKGNRLEDRMDLHYNPQKSLPKNKQFIIKLDPFLFKYSETEKGNQRYDDKKIFSQMRFPKLPPRDFYLPQVKVPQSNLRSSKGLNKSTPGFSLQNIFDRSTQIKEQRMNTTVQQVEESSLFTNKFEVRK